jgi:hypothetical protein
VRGEPVDLHVVVLHLADQPAGVGPLPAQVAGRAHGEVLVVPGGPQLVEGVADLGVRVGDRHLGALGGEHDGEQGHDQRGVPLVQQVQHGVLERPDGAQVRPFGTSDHRRTA